MADVAIEFQRIYERVCKESEENNQMWVRGLREAGVKAAHPDDGWVNNERNEVVLAYPQFNDGLEVGDVLALGYHFTDTRYVKVVGFRAHRFSGDERQYVQFEEEPNA